LNSGSDQDHCHNDGPKLTAARNSYCCRAEAGQGDRRNKDQNLEAQAERCTNQSPDSDDTEHHDDHPRDDYPAPA
jgi:hypothetical protein